jgi:hypothetical protein
MFEADAPPNAVLIDAFDQRQPDRRLHIDSAIALYAIFHFKPVASSPLFAVWHRDTPKGHGG